LATRPQGLGSSPAGFSRQRQQRCQHEAGIDGSDPRRRQQETHLPPGGCTGVSLWLELGQKEAERERIGQH
jgi:hypothetical protein